MKDKERILKAAREKETVTYKEIPIRLSADFSKETFQARRGWKEVIKVMKGKDLHPRLKTERIVKGARGKERVTYTGVSIRLSADFSKETL